MSDTKEAFSRHKFELLLADLEETKKTLREERFDNEERIKRYEFLLDDQRLEVAKIVIRHIPCDSPPAQWAAKVVQHTDALFEELRRGR